MGIAGLLRFEDCVQQLHVCTLTVPAAAQGHYAPLGMCRLTWAEPLCCKVEEYNQSSSPSRSSIAGFDFFFIRR